ncbi:uncharacterized protein EV420DRAFT_1492916 [Desarmillaria tabescens]|uniref:Yeast cell wall synthesis Kre9/Knh1-like N-terminal domain-containing protein n=1 Tax=Armillaria tabescens TaxID=1929756 RepID=A0AA39TXD5_ARMTA|nr:uncharacterized protein EV420DRAFT_1492916 [Desarmillaria tabescens]KAK0469183.1 hypothetical protein EV420DRAFT_1492916 [Desarmillaria tabescens]
MFPFSALVLASIVLDFILHTNAALSVRSLYVIEPNSGSSCHGGQNCTVEWLDDGTWPLLSSFGVSTVGLYTGTQQLVQTLDPVDTSATHSLTFTPIPEAGPNSDTYYICFTSTSVFDNGTAVMAFSPFFQLDQMTGSFTTPWESATASIAIPTSLTQTSADSTSELSTIIVGTLSTSLPPLTSLSATSPATSSSSITTSRMSTSSAPQSTSTSASAAASTQSGTANGALSRTNAVSPLIMGVLSLCYFIVCVL